MIISQSRVDITVFMSRPNHSEDAGQQSCINGRN